MVEFEISALLDAALGPLPVPVAHRCLARPGGLAALLKLEAEELAQTLKVPVSAALGLAAGMELGRRAVEEAAPLPKPLCGGGDVYRHLAPRMARKRTECFYALDLDAKGRLLAERLVSEGTLTASLVHPREVFAPALKNGAAAVVVAHNHPSGDPEMSAEDRATTRRLQRAGKLLGVELLDHVILGAGRYTSFLEEGLL